MNKENLVIDRKDQTIWKRLFALARPERKKLFWGTFFLILSSSSNLVYPQAIRLVIDEAIKAKDFSRINTIALFIFAAFIVQAMASTLRYWIFTLVGERIVMSLRDKLYSHLLDQDISFYDSTKTGEILSRLASDTTLIQNAVSVNVSMGLRNLASALGGLALMVYTSSKLSLLMLVVVPPVAIGAAFFGKRIRTFSRKVQDALAESSVVAEETIGGIRTVRSFAQESFEKARYRQALNLAFTAVRQRVQQIAGFMTLASILGYSSIAFIVWMGGRQVIEGSLTMGDLTQFLVYLMMVAFSVGTLGGLWGDFMAAQGAARRVFELLDRQPDVLLEKGRILDSVQGNIRFEGVSFAYPMRPDFPVLKGFFLNIEPNQVVALVGPSGSGKTTIMSLLSRFYEPTEGTIWIDNAPLDQLQPNWIRRQIGLVSQEPVLISSTIAENIRYGNLNATQEDVIAAAKAANAFDFIEKFPDGFNTTVGERGVQLSGGQKQRIAIARAVLKNPRVLILDEATSALDTESEALVQGALQKLMAGRTTLVIAHRLATIQNADLIAVIDQGELKQLGTHQSLLKEDGVYRKLIEKQLYKN